MARQKIEFEISANNRKAIHSMDKFKQKVGRIANSVAGQLGMALSAGAIISYGKRLLEQGDQVAKLGKRFGMTAEQVQKFQYMAERSGSSLESMAKAQKTLTANINDANMGMTSYIRYFKQMGVDYKALNKLAPEKQFEEVAKALGSMNNKQRQNALAARLLGRSAGELIPMFEDYNNLAKEAQNYVVFTDQQAKDAEKYADAMTNIEKTFKSIAVNTGFIGFVADWTDALDKAIMLQDKMNKSKESGASGKLTNSTRQYSQVGAKAMETYMTAFNPAAMLANMTGLLPKGGGGSGEMISVPAAELKIQTQKLTEIADGVKGNKRY